MKIKHVLAAALALLISGAPQSFAQYEVNDFAIDPLTSDMALIYSGDSSRPSWGQANLKPYLMHTYADGSQPTWMFDSFLFLEFGFQGRRIDNYSGQYNLQGATQAQWEQLFKIQMGIANKNQGMTVLDNMITTLKKTLGEPAIKHKVVIQLPTPRAGQTDWGKVNDRTLNFNSNADMLTAMKWAVDRILELWAQCNFKNIDLIGVYCVDETMGAVGDRFKAIKPYLTEKGLKLYWIPYYTSNPTKTKWKDYGVDVAYLQPNYYFEKNIYKTQLRAAIDEAKKYGMGLELEFQPDGMWNYNRTSSETDMTVPSNASFYTRLVDYIDEFEAKGVFDKSAIAYYSGNDGFTRFANSSSAEDLAVMDRLAHLIDARHKKLSAGIDNVTVDNDALNFATTANGAIVMHSPSGSIYSINGTLLHSGQGTFYCPSGIYIAVDGLGHSVKIAMH